MSGIVTVEVVGGIAPVVAALHPVLLVWRYKQRFSCQIHRVALDFEGMERMHGTTIVAVRRDGVTAIAGDGQVTLGQTIMKTGAVKVRRLEQGGGILVGFAGAVADALTLLEKFEGALSGAKGNLLRAAIETAKLWRTDRVLRNLEAMLVLADRDTLLLLSGNGEVLSPDEPVIAVGSGGPYALTAAKALLRHSSLSAPQIAEQAIRLAGEIDLYTSGQPTQVLSVGGTP